MTFDYRHLVIKLGRLHALERIKRHRALASFPVYTGQHPILAYIAEHEPCSQRELSDWLNVSPPSVATSLKRMQRAGLLTRESDETDQRYNRISLTPKGREITKAVRGCFEEIDRVMFQDFSENELQLFEQMLSHCIQNLTDEEEASRSTFSLLNEVHALKNCQQKEDEPNEKNSSLS